MEDDWEKILEKVAMPETILSPDEFSLAYSLTYNFCVRYSQDPNIRKFMVEKLYEFTQKYEAISIQQKKKIAAMLSYMLRHITSPNFVELKKLASENETEKLNKIKEFFDC